MGLVIRLWNKATRRSAPVAQAPIPRPDPDRIAVLEHELLDITPEPGTPAARAVALSKPVDKETCPHEDVIDITELGQARHTGLCQHCGADMVETDTGEWQRP